MLPGDVGKWGQHCPHKITFSFREGRREGGDMGERRGGKGGRERGERKGEGRREEEREREEVNAISGDETSGCSVYLQSRFSLHKHSHSHVKTSI